MYYNNAVSGGSAIYATKATNLRINNATMNSNISSAGTGGAFMIVGCRNVNLEYNTVF
jgi:hypothetical protein